MNNILNREESIANVKTRIRRITGPIFDDIYDNIRISMNQKHKDSEMSRRDKIIYIEENIEFVDDEQLVPINKLMSLSLVETLDKKRVRVALETINKILEAHEKPPINDLCDFSNFPRKLLTGELCKNVFNQNLDYVFANGFGKTECKNYNKTVVNPHISLLRTILKKSGYDLCGKNKVTGTGEDRSIDTHYSIRKNQ